MVQIELFPDDNKEPSNRIAIGNGYSIEWLSPTLIAFYRMGVPLKHSQILSQIDKRRLAIELALECSVTKLKLAHALRISRQSLDNWIDTFKRSGFEGLVNSYKGGKRSGRAQNADRLPTGNKARILEEERRQKREAKEKRQLSLPLFNDEKPAEQEQGVDVDSQPSDIFNEEFDFEENRYAGSFVYWGIIQHYFNFMSFCETHLLNSSIVVYMFVMMLINNIESIEQLKTIFKREFGKIIGIKRLFSKPIVWEKIYELCGLKRSKAFIEAFFDRQVKRSLVALSWLYIDGHFIPYYGKARVHHGYYTQRDQTMPGQTQMYVHDGHGRVVYFETQDGKGDLKEMMRRMSERWSSFLGGEHPLIIADRESWGVEHFIAMKDYRFVTWEKFSKAEEMALIPEESFGAVFLVNDIEYQALEDLKEYRGDSNAVTLRRIIIWNKKSNRRVACVTRQEEKEDTISIASAMLGRWGASENSFKHMADRFNMHYNPVKDASRESDRQDMPNPDYKSMKKALAVSKKELAKCERTLGKLPISKKKDGSLRHSKRREALIEKQKMLKAKILELSAKMKDCPERVEIKEEDDKFREIEIEGKNYWDLAQGLAWNSRKKLITIFGEFLPNQRDLIPVLDAVTRSRGWIRSTASEVEIVLEPLEIPRFQVAQNQLCQKLNEMGIKLHNGKRLLYAVGHKP
jgi:hypothetical protein